MFTPNLEPNSAANCNKKDFMDQFMIHRSASTILTGLFFIMEAKINITGAELKEQQCLFRCRRVKAG